MTNWGQKEHKFEGYTTWLLVIGTIISALYFYNRELLLAYLAMGILVLTLLVHLIARSFHCIEKYTYNKRFR